MLVNYVHPIKNYVTNGEVITRYKDGTETVTSLVPPYNIDTFFQQFAIESSPVRVGKLILGNSWTFVHMLSPERRAKINFAHGNAVKIDCDPAKEVDSIELRAVCSEAVIGLMGLTIERTY
jgi:hypothetical protein